MQSYRDEYKAIIAGLGAAIKEKAGITETVKLADLENIVRTYWGEGGNKDYYTGSYEVTPLLEEQVLLTEEKTMSNNLVVNPIPYYEVSNNYNGVTVVIGKKQD